MNAREEFAGRFRELQPKFAQLHANILEPTGLTLSQYALLNQLLLLGSVSMTEISSRLRITKPAVTNLVDRLEEKKFLKRIPHPQDRRIILLEVLPKGRKILTGIQAAILGMLLEAYDQFDSTEHKVISRFYAALSKTMDVFLLRTQNEK